MRHKILCTIGNFDEAARAALVTIGDVTSASFTREALRSRLADVEILITGLDHSIDADLLAAAPKLQIIATPATGTDHIDCAAAKARGIAVLSLRGDTEFLQGITGTAELAFALMLDLLRHTHEAAESVRRGEWRRDAWMGQSAFGKTLGIIGLGRLGSLMARFGSAFGMRILYTDPAVTSDAYERIALSELLRESDVVSLHVHLTADTAGLIDAAALAQMKPSAMLINTSRGKIVDEAAVLSALKSGQLGGYAADVLGNELTFRPDAARDPLIAYAKKHRNILITPHIGGMTSEARAATDRRIATMIQRMLAGTLAGPT